MTEIEGKPIFGRVSEGLSYWDLTVMVTKNCVGTCQNAHCLSIVV